MRQEIQHKQAVRKSCSGRWRFLNTIEPTTLTHLALGGGSKVRSTRVLLVKEFSGFWEKIMIM